MIENIFTLQQRFVMCLNGPETESAIFQSIECAPRSRIGCFLSYDSLASSVP